MIGPAEGSLAQLALEGLVSCMLSEVFIDKDSGSVFLKMNLIRFNASFGSGAGWIRKKVLFRMAYPDPDPVSLKVKNGIR